LVLLFLERVRGLVTECRPIYSFWTDYATELGGKTAVEIVAKENLLGGGTFGNVYQCTWNGESAVIKHNVVRRTENWDVFAREVKILSILRDVQGVVKMHACAESILSVTIVLERLHKDFYEMASAVKALNEPVRMHLYAKIAKILGQIHMKGVFHNDIKPENIMSVDEKLREVRVIDFGLSCVGNEKCFGGTPIFNAPEKIRSLAANDPRGSEKIDVWAFLLTIAVFEYGTYFGVLNKSVDLACFRLSFDSTCHEKLLRNVGAMMEKSPVGLRQFVLESLKMDPKERPTMEMVRVKLLTIERVMYFMRNGFLSPLAPYYFPLAMGNDLKKKATTNSPYSRAKQMWHQIFKSQSYQMPVLFLI